jgi:hypothetical protein
MGKKREFFESHLTQLKHNRHMEHTSVQKSADYKTLMLLLLGEITFVIGPDYIFCKLVRRMRLIGLTVWHTISEDLNLA